VAGGFDDRVGPVFNRPLRFEAKDGASREEPLLGLGWQGRKRREALRRRQFEPVEIEPAALGFQQAIRGGSGEIVQ